MRMWRNRQRWQYGTFKTWKKCMKIPRNSFDMKFVVVNWLNQMSYFCCMKKKFNFFAFQIFAKFDRMTHKPNGEKYRMCNMRMYTHATNQPTKKRTIEQIK